MNTLLDENTGGQSNREGKVALAVKSTLTPKPLVACFSANVTVAEALKQMAQRAGQDGAELRASDRLRREMASTFNVFSIRSGKLHAVANPDITTLGEVAEEKASETGTTRVAALLAQAYQPVG